MTKDDDNKDAFAVPVIGLASLTHGAYAGIDLQPIWEGLLARTRFNPYDAGALMDIGTILQLKGDKVKGLEAQFHAIAQHPLFSREGEAGGLKLLAFVRPGDLMANTPLDFLLEGSSTTLIELYIREGEPLPPIPDHDLAFVAIGESEQARAALDDLKHMIGLWPRPVLNKQIEIILGLSRDKVSAFFTASESVLAPKTLRLGRKDLLHIAAGERISSLNLEDLVWPLVIRPVDSHAGNDLGRANQPEDLKPYLDHLKNSDQEVFFLAPFIDYKNEDGCYRKYRIVFIDRIPYISHMAISSHWMVHYLNSEMTINAAFREEEAQLMANFDETFAKRHAKALSEICQKIPLDYFAIDCAEAPDGRLLLFEADIAMIIHAMDDPELFPYKEGQMKKVFQAFQDLLTKTAKT